MYYNKRKLIISSMWIVLGIVFIVLDIMGIATDSAFTAIGAAWIVVGVLQIYKNIKYHTNEDYKEQIDIACSDERNKFIRMKAWSYAGYIFVLGSAVVSIVLFLLGITVYAQILSYCMCSILVVYYIAYLYLQKKC